MASIIKDPRGNGSWIVRYRDNSGAQRKKSFSRKLDAERWAAQIKVDLQRGHYIDPKRAKQPLGPLAEQWATHLSHVKPSTRSRYRGIVNKHIVPTWGGWQVGKINPSDINNWIAELVDSDLKPGSVRQIHRVLSLILDAAVRDDIIGRNPAKGVQLPRAVRNEPRYLSLDELMTLADKAGEYRLHILVLGLTGLRFGEFAALKVRRFDRLRRRLTVAESVTDIGGQLVWTTPKTHQSRTVPVPASLAGEIAALTRGKSPDDLIFTSPKGHTLRIGNWRKLVFDPACRAAGISNMTPHDLRHTAASLAVQSGANVKVVQRMLGHASAAMTLDIYAGLFADDLDTVATTLDSLLCATDVPQTAMTPSPA